jgi:hypothetical protein
MLSTIWDLMAPVVFFKLSQAKLTFVDLTVDPFVRRQYLLARGMYDTWTNGNILAGVEPRIEYDDSQLVTRQHLLPGHLDQIIEAMTFRDAGGQQQLMPFGQFYESSLDTNSAISRSSQRIVYPLTNFHPNSKQVLWRLLVVQAHICQALIRTSDASRITVHPLDALSQEDRKKFDWQTPSLGESDDGAIEEPFAAARRYLKDYIHL